MSALAAISPLSCAASYSSASRILAAISARVSCLGSAGKLLSFDDSSFSLLGLPTVCLYFAAPIFARSAYPSASSQPGGRPLSCHRRHVAHSRCPGPELRNWRRQHRHGRGLAACAGLLSESRHFPMLPASCPQARSACLIVMPARRASSKAATARRLCSMSKTFRIVGFPPKKSPAGEPAGQQQDHETIRA